MRKNSFVSGLLVGALAVVIVWPTTETATARDDRTGLLPPIFKVGNVVTLNSTRDARRITAVEGEWIEVSPPAGKPAAVKPWINTGAMNTTWTVMDLEAGIFLLMTKLKMEATDEIRKELRQMSAKELLMRFHDLLTRENGAGKKPR